MLNLTRPRYVMPMHGDYKRIRLHGMLAEIEPDDAALRDRRTLSADGLVIVVATVSVDDGEVAADPEISFRGVPMQPGDDSERLLDELADVVEDSLEEGLRGHVREPAMIRQDVHDAVATFVYKRLKRRPMVLPVVIEV